MSFFVQWASREKSLQPSIKHSFGQLLSRKKSKYVFLAAREVQSPIEGGRENSPVKYSPDDNFNVLGDEVNLL